MDDNLKRCPCCASKAKSRELESGQGLVFCPACHLTTDWCDSLEEAISKWNTRELATSQPVKAEDAPGHWELIWVDEPSSTAGRSHWRNPWDVTYTIQSPEVIQHANEVLDTMLQRNGLEP